MHRHPLSALALVVLSLPASAQQVFTDCTEDQESTILTAQSLVPGMIDSALPHVVQGGLYERWFGVWTDQRGGTVRANLETIKSQALIGAPAYSCVASTVAPCDDGSFAAIWKGTSFEIMICDPFWSLPGIGIGSQAGAILHEISHFHLGAQTEDYCYENDVIGDCLDLAIAKPDEAIQSAPNYMYFVEEVP